MTVIGAAFGANRTCWQFWDRRLNIVDSSAARIRAKAHEIEAAEIGPVCWRISEQDWNRDQRLDRLQNKHKQTSQQGEKEPLTWLTWSTKLTAVDRYISGIICHSYQETLAYRH